MVVRIAALVSQHHRSGPPCRLLTAVPTTCLAWGCCPRYGGPIEGSGYLIGTVVAALALALVVVVLRGFGCTVTEALGGEGKGGRSHLLVDVEEIGLLVGEHNY